MSGNLELSYPQSLTIAELVCLEVAKPQVFGRCLLALVSIMRNDLDASSGESTIFQNERNSLSLISR